MLDVELHRLPAPFNDANSTPEGQEGIGRAIALPSLYIRRLHIHLPARLRIARTRTIKFDTDDAITQFERSVVQYSRVWRPDLNCFTRCATSSCAHIVTGRGSAKTPG